MKSLLRTGIATAVVLTATGALVAITNYTDNHRILKVDGVASVEMSNSLASIENDMAARMEAQEVATIIGKIDHVSLTSYAELQEARELYENASSSARAYIDEEQLIIAEETYAQLEAEREELLAEARANGDIDGMLDYTYCDVQSSGNEYLDSMVQELIQKATTEDMSRSEQLKACYCYMVSNYSYAYNYNYSYGNGPKSVAWATAFLRDGYGACNNWSSAFMYVARALGYDTELYYGSTATSRGGSTEHYWPVIRIDGTDYVFDPQVEADMYRKSGNISFHRYGLAGNAADAKYFFSTVVQ